MCGRPEKLKTEILKTSVFLNTPLSPTNTPFTLPPLPFRVGGGCVRVWGMVLGKIRAEKVNGKNFLEE